MMLILNVQYDMQYECTPSIEFLIEPGIIQLRQTDITILKMEKKKKKTNQQIIFGHEGNNIRTEIYPLKH